MAKSELQTTSFDAEELKQSLIDFLKSTNEFGDFDYEGSAINTMVDLLTRNTTYTAFLANMLANESFINSAQIRSNVVSHAQKLSYIPKSETVARLICTVEVTPVDTMNLSTSIVMDRGTVFLANIAGNTYSFVTNESYILNYSTSRGTYRATGVDLYQGQLITNRFVHEFGDEIIIPNTACDRSTLKVSVSESGGSTDRAYMEATAIDSLQSNVASYFVSETVNQRTAITFGRDILGVEPADGSIVNVTYVLAEEEHANGITNLIPGSTIAGYSDIMTEVTTPSYGGSPKEDIERIRFIAPKYYQAQGRALTDSDYIPILQSEFSFIRSAISWGGEKNIPPTYGSVYISILSEEGGEVTNAVIQQMVNFLEDRNVGSITPIIVSPELFGIRLYIAFSYDNRLTNKSFNEMTTEINTVVNDYNEELFDFGRFYNEAELNYRIKNIKGVVTMDIDKRQFKEIDVLRFENPIYNIRFNNAIEEGQVRMENFAIAQNGENHLMYDDDGELFVQYTNQSNETITVEVGTVEYDTGTLDFSMNMIQEANTVQVEVHTIDDNFYVEQNQVVFIDSVEFDLLDTRTR